MKENPDFSVGEIGKLLGKMWKNVSDRSAFESKARKEKATYNAKMEKYVKSASYKKQQMKMLAWKIHCTKKPFGKDPNAPKRALSAYMLYAASVHSKIVAENPDMAVGDIMKEQSVWWKGLSESERQPWVAKAAAAKKKHAAQSARYMKTADYQSFVKEREAYKQEMLEKRNKLMGKKRARTPTKDAKSPSKKKQKRIPRSPKAAKRSTSRRKARTPKAPKRSKSASRRRTKRRCATPKAAKKGKRSAARKSRTPKAPKKSSRSASTSR